MDQLEVIYAGSGKSVNCAAQTCILPSRSDLCWAGQVSELRPPDFVMDQLEVIYAGPGRSVNCTARTCNGPARSDLCWAGQVSELRRPDL